MLDKMNVSTHATYCGISPDYCDRTHCEHCDNELTIRDITFRECCKEIVSHPEDYFYNIGANYVGITFNTYQQMWAFKKSDLYKRLRPFKVLNRYTKYLLFMN